MQRALQICLGLTVLTRSLPAPGGDWPQWGGTPQRNMVSQEKGLPDGFQPAGEKEKSASEPLSGPYLKWVVKLGARTHGTPTVAGGRVFVGTNNPVSRDGKTTWNGDDAGGRLLALEEQTGKLLWDLAMPRLPERRAPHSDNGYGVCSSVAVEGNRAYVVSHRTDVLCLDVEGLANGNDGPFLDEASYLAAADDAPAGQRPTVQLRPTDADIIWRYNIFEQLDAHPHDGTACSPLVYGDYVYVCTGNGINGAETKVLNPLAPSFIVLDKRTGRLVAKDDERIGTRLFKGQWSSPSLCQAGGKTLILFGAGDGLCYAFEPVTPPAGGKVATLRKVWAVDCVPPECKFRNGRPVGYREENGPSEIVGTPAWAGGRVYVTIGRDPNRGEGKGNLVCIDPVKGCLVWSYGHIGRSMSTVSVAGGLLYVGETFGVVHCVDAGTGEGCWTHEVNGRIWGSTLVADGRLWVPTSRGLSIFALGREKHLLRTIKIGSGCYSSPVAANGVLYIASMRYLYALSLKGNGRQP
ncbi:MAG: PQQ-binding-like beta-propeller repeat protein [Thermoguttaceae bacterium]